MNIVIILDATLILYISLAHLSIFLLVVQMTAEIF